MALALEELRRHGLTKEGEAALRKSLEPLKGKTVKAEELAERMLSGKTAKALGIDPERAIFGVFKAMLDETLDEAYGKPKEAKR